MLGQLQRGGQNRCRMQLRGKMNACIVIVNMFFESHFLFESCTMSLSDSDSQSEEIMDEFQRELNATRAEQQDLGVQVIENGEWNGLSCEGHERSVICMRGSNS